MAAVHPAMSNLLRVSFLARRALDKIAQWVRVTTRPLSHAGSAVWAIVTLAASQANTIIPAAVSAVTHLLSFTNSAMGTRHVVLASGLITATSLSIARATFWAAVTLAATMTYSTAIGVQGIELAHLIHSSLDVLPHDRMNTVLRMVMEAPVIRNSLLMRHRHAMKKAAR